MSRYFSYLRLALIFSLLIFFGLIINGNSSHIINNNKINSLLNHTPDTSKLLHFFHQPDTIHYHYIKNSSKSEANFTYTKYVEFLTKISDTSKYTVLPLNEFRKTFRPNKIVIGLRHDVDLDLKLAKKLSTVENNFGFRSTYFILHTASYYLKKPDSMAVHSESILPTLKEMQDDYNDEIGWHNDLVTLQLVYKINPVSFLHQELNWLRSNNLNITGTASHGSSFCSLYKYLNFYFFDECKYPIVGQYINNERAIVNGSEVTLQHGHLRDFGLDYEAYFLNNNKYYSDASFINGQRWNIGLLDLKTLKSGDRLIILMHPCYYYSSGSSLAEITQFSMHGQLSSEINPMNATISVDIPWDYNIENLKADFLLSAGARARIGSKELMPNSTAVDFTNPVLIKVVAEDGLTFKTWTISVNRIPTNTNPIVQISPNPAKSRLNLEFSNVLISPSKLYIINIKGQIEYSTQLVGKGFVNYSVDLSRLINGYYFVKLVSGNKQVVGTFVINK